MVSSHKERQATRAQNNDPINYTCGTCQQVHPFDSQNPYICPDVEEENGN